MIELNINDILKETKEIKEKKVWYVAIIWRPNAWKSTFINSLIWEKVSITSSIPQTTRKRVLAIYNDEESQVVFFDTPWIHSSTKEFNQSINSQAIRSIREADMILYFIDSSRERWEEEEYIENILELCNNKIIKVYTKADIWKYFKDDWIKISSIDKTWFEDLLINIKDNLKIQSPFYPDDYYTDQDIYFRISEIVREKVFLNTKQEVPHSVYVEIEELEEIDNLLKIQAYIYTETDSQRYIIIWKNWELITKIWKEARLELEKIFSKKVFISLRVKTLEKWRKNKKIINNILK